MTEDAMTAALRGRYMADPIEYEIEENLAGEEIAKRLEELAAGIRRGAYTLGFGADSVAVKFPPTFELSLEVEYNPAKSKWSVDLGMAWKDA